MSSAESFPLQTNVSAETTDPWPNRLRLVEKPLEGSDQIELEIAQLALKNEVIIRGYD